MSSIFDSLSSKALGITQGFFGESVTYKQDESEVELKAVFKKQYIEINGYASLSLVAEILESDLTSTPSKGDLIIRGDKTYKVENPQLSNGVYQFLLKE